MSPREFELALKKLEIQYRDFYVKNAPAIAAKVAVGYFKKSFQTESWNRVKWKDVKRRMPGWTRKEGATQTRKILTGETGDLGRSIQSDKSRTGSGKAVVWTAPSSFTRSDRIYAAVHNEGLKAGRGKGFIMPKRQFMGESPELNKLIVEELQRKLADMAQKL